MIKLKRALSSWGSISFKQVLKQELAQLPLDNFPLHKATQYGGIIDESDISFSIITIDEKPGYLIIKTGIFFLEIIGGCSCGDDPGTENIYCECILTIDRDSAEASFDFLKN